MDAAEEVQEGFTIDELNEFLEISMGDFNTGFIHTRMPGGREPLVQKAAERGWLRYVERCDELDRCKIYVMTEKGRRVCAFVEALRHSRCA